MKVAMTNIYVNNPIKAFEFYTTVLGFKEFMFSKEHNLAIVVSTDQPDGTVLLLEPNESKIANKYQTDLYKAGLPAIVLSTKNLEIEYNRLVKEGIKFSKSPTPTDWGTESIFDDKNGNWILLIEELKDNI